MPDARFQILSGALKALSDAEIIKELGLSEPDGVKRLKTTASSTITDLAGDEMTEKALNTMKQTAERGMTIFLNHKYMVPEDVLGSVEKATIVRRDDYVDLDLIIRVDESNERATKTHSQISNGTKLGTSIGALIPEGGATKTEKGLKIDEVYLLEASIVGLPANPRSFVQYAVKGYADALKEEEESAEPVIAAGAVTVVNGLPNDPKLIERLQKANEAPLETNERGEPKVEDVIADAEAAREGDAEEAVATSPVTERDAATTEDAPPAEGDEGTTDTEAAKEAAAPATQELSTSDPENEGNEGDLTEDLATKSVDVIRSLMRDTAEKLADAQAALVTKDQQIAQITAERDELLEDVKIAAQIIERIAALPMGRRTSFVAEVSDFRTKFADKGIYSADVLQLVESNTDE